MKHTSGPWKYVLAITANSLPQYVITTGKWGAPNIALLGDNEANAKLISAAPELAEAVHLLMMSGVFHNTSWDERAKEAIRFSNQALIKAGLL